MLVNIILKKACIVQLKQLLTVIGGTHKDLWTLSHYTSSKLKQIAVQYIDFDRYVSKMIFRSNMLISQQCIAVLYDVREKQLSHAYLSSFLFIKFTCYISNPVILNHKLIKYLLFKANAFHGIVDYVIVKQPIRKTITVLLYKQPCDRTADVQADKKTPMQVDLSLLK